MLAFDNDAGAATSRKKECLTMITITQLQQFLFCAAWMWPAGVMLSGGSSDVKNVEAAMFWLFVWIICGIRLFAKKRWPFNAGKKLSN